MVDVTDATFESAVLARSDQVPVIVDLWAPWCGPCKTLTPILERVVASANGSVELVKVNIDENPQVAASFQVQSIPAVYAVRNRQGLFCTEEVPPPLKTGHIRLVLVPSHLHRDQCRRLTRLRAGEHTGPGDPDVRCPGKRQ